MPDGCVDPVDFAKLEKAFESIAKEVAELKRYLQHEYLRWVEDRIRRLEADVEAHRKDTKEMVADHRAETAEFVTELRTTLREISRNVWIVSGSLSVVSALIIGVIMFFITGSGQ